MYHIFTNKYISEELILEGNIVGRRHVGNPRKRWVNAVQIGSREILKERNVRRESLDT
jgi:hypothetical protein